MHTESFEEERRRMPVIGEVSAQLAGWTDRNDPRYRSRLAIWACRCAIGRMNERESRLSTSVPEWEHFTS